MGHKYFEMSEDEVYVRAERAIALIRNALKVTKNNVIIGYAIPRGGIEAAKYVQDVNVTWTLNPGSANFFFDDIIDSGATARKYEQEYPGKHTVALVNKLIGEFPDEWIVFPWEQDKAEDFAHTVRRMLQHIGEDANREGLLETPHRVAKAWETWCSGYGVDPSTVLKEFEDGGERYDEMILVRDIPFYSHCEHHMAPFFGTADIAYIPDGKIVGLSKLSRLLDVFARRLQVQERLTAQVADALMDHLKAKGAAVSLRARHLCMESRGIQKQGSETVTNALRGVFMSKPEARAEFFSSLR